MHGDLAPARVAHLAVPEEGHELLVAFLEDVRGDLEAIAHFALGRIAASVDGRLHALDDHCPFQGIPVRPGDGRGPPRCHVANPRAWARGASTPRASARSAQRAKNRFWGAQ